ncbi:MAG TPA: LPXTG cell wall anchor domain-containing protein [Chryseolinea sp.]|nr:LPXTG cell wall anchor domain-containing protein [Chryseolinea sp.]
MHGISLGDVAVQAAAVAKPSVWDNINNVITKVVQPAANVYTQIKTNQPVPTSTTPGYTPQPYLPSAPPPPTPAVDNTKKYLMIGGAVLLGGTVIYFVTRKKKK